MSNGAAQQVTGLRLDRGGLTQIARSLLRLLATAFGLLFVALAARAIYFGVIPPAIDAAYVLQPATVVAINLPVPVGLGVNSRGEVIVPLPGGVGRDTRLTTIRRDGTTTYRSIPVPYAVAVAVSRSDEIVTANSEPKASIYRISGEAISREQVPDLNFPNALAFDNDGSLISVISDPYQRHNDRVVRISQGGQVSDVYDGLMGVDGVAVSEAGDILILGRSRSTSGADGVLLRLGADGSVRVVATGFSGPHAVAVDLHGNAYVASFGSDDWHLTLPRPPLPVLVPRGYIVRVGRDGDVRTVIDNLNDPAGLAIDEENNLYVSVDYSKILKFPLVDASKSPTGR